MPPRGNRDGNGHAVDSEATVRHRDTDTLQRRGRRLQVEIVHQHHEFLASRARDQVALARRLLQAVRGESQHLVAHPVAMGIVDRLEMVDVDHPDGQPAPVSRALPNAMFPSATSVRRLGRPVR